MLANFPGVDFLARDSTQVYKAKEKFGRRLFTSSIKREIWHFHVVVVQDGRGGVMQEQVCCFGK